MNYEKVQYFHNSAFALRVAPSQIPDAGLGVYTDSDIPAGACIDEYTGDYKSFGGAYALQIRPGLNIDGAVWPRSYMAIINDCTYIAPRYKKRKGRRIDITPAAYYDAGGTQVLAVNCEFRIVPEERRAWVHATCDIPAGSELFIAYGKDYWR